MAIGTPVQLGAAASSASGTSLALTTAANCPAGSLIIVCIATGGGQTLTGAIDSAGNAYTLLNQTAGVGFPTTGILYCANCLNLPSGGTITGQWNTTVTNNVITAMCVSGIAASSPVDSQNHMASGTAAAATSVATGTLIQADELIIGFTGLNGAGTGYTPGGSFTSIGGATIGTARAIQTGYQIVSATTSVAYAPSWTTSAPYRTGVVSFKASTAVNGGATLAGTSGVSSVGTLNAGVQSTLLGVQGFSAIGTLAARGDVTLALIGNFAASAVGSIVGSVAKTLAGSSIISTAGLLGIAVNPSLTGVQGYSSAGALAARIDEIYLITGAAAVGVAGNVISGVIPSLQGASAQLSLGALSLSAGPTIQGAGGTGLVGDLIVIYSKLVSILGAQALSAIGSMALSHTDNPPPPNRQRTTILVRNVEDRKIPVFVPTERRAVRLPNVPEVEQSRKSLV